MEHSKDDLKKDSKFWRVLGRAHIKLWKQQSDVEKEDVHLKRAYQALSMAMMHFENTSDVSLWVESAEVHALLGSFQGAAQTLAKVVTEFKTYRNMASVIFQAAVVLKQLGKYVQARAYLRHICKAAPKPFTEGELCFFSARLQEQANGAQAEFTEAFSLLGSNTTASDVNSWKADPKTWRKIAEKCQSASYDLCSPWYI
jgi:tetratricopeptide (TPR) repeat protein